MAGMNVNARGYHRGGHKGGRKYQELRARNNIALKKNRDKAREQSKLIKRRVEELELKNPEAETRNKHSF